ncbi:MAG: hypothetical protein P8186_09285 [Anaerolineae bacterium]
MAYRIVGGTSVVLHGVPIPVKDLDLETDVEGAYRFQALFAGYTLESVALHESEIYRSHFGRFDFDGVTVEVMGDLHRREAGGWVPTAGTTKTAVNLDGVLVRAFWLEEETLAYIRRGRLERAPNACPTAIRRGCWLCRAAKKLRRCCDEYEALGYSVSSWVDCRRHTGRGRWRPIECRDDELIRGTRPSAVCLARGEYPPLSRW